ncbi:alpha/beta-hydrolase [Lenzites betulinus]|nr:alpha/beta-hydrolase [Lenzites betulinus]
MNDSKTGSQSLASTGAHPCTSDPAVILPRRKLTRVCWVLVIVAAAVALQVRVCCPFRAREHDSDPTPSHGSPRFDWSAVEPSRSIKWTNCYAGHRCARLLLPLDYETPDGPTTAIALRMVPATDRANYRGPILINPGGPGESGTKMVGRFGLRISRVVGGEFDVLGFDPRGIGASMPSASCFDTDSQRALWRLQEDARLLNASDDSTVYLELARQSLMGQRCEQKIGGERGIGRFMGTPDVARDMLEISQLLGQEKLQYWGFSYGSVLGQYFSAIYPDKIGRVIIDGVYDAHNYRAALWSTNLADMDAIIGSFFHFCHQAGPEKCSVYDSSPEKIRARYYALLESVETAPVPIAGASPPLVVTRKILQNQMFEATYEPSTRFPIVADTMRALERGNEAALVWLAPKIVDPTECKCDLPAPTSADNEAFNAIACGDADGRPFDAAAYAAYYAALARDSPLAAPFWSHHYLMCSQWRVRPNARYTGPLEAANTSHPLLVVSPRWDPVCPLSDAVRVQARYGGAGLLVQNSYGHCSISAPSLCTARHIRAYMVNGTLPSPGTVCEVEELPFVGSVQDVRALSAEDSELLEALKGLTAEVPMLGAR